MKLTYADLLSKETYSKFTIEELDKLCSIIEVVRKNHFSLNRDKLIAQIEEARSCGLTGDDIRKIVESRLTNKTDQDLDKNINSIPCIDDLYPNQLISVFLLNVIPSRSFPFIVGNIVVHNVRHIEPDASDRIRHIIYHVQCRNCGSSYELSDDSVIKHYYSKSCCVRCKGILPRIKKIK